MSTIPPVSDPRFDPSYAQPDEPPKKRSPWTGCLIGCLVVLVVLFVLGVLAAIWIYQNGRALMAEGMSQAMKAGIQSLDLPAEEKVDINVQIDRLATAFRDGKLPMERWALFMQEFARSPLMTSLIVSAMEQRYFSNSGLNEEEKAQGRITLQRFIRGVIDEKINRQGIDAAMVHVANRRPDGQWELRQRLTDADLRAFLAAAKAEADTAEIEETPADFDPSDAFKRIVDQVLGEPADNAGKLPDESAKAPQ